MAVPGDVRAVGALSDGVLDERRGLPVVAALFARFRRGVLCEMKAVERADGLQKTANSSASRRRSSLFAATQICFVVIKLRRMKFVLS